MKFNKDVARRAKTTGARKNVARTSAQASSSARGAIAKIMNAKDNRQIVKEATKLTKTAARPVTPRSANRIVKKAEKITKKTSTRGGQLREIEKSANRDIKRIHKDIKTLKKEGKVSDRKAVKNALSKPKSKMDKSVSKSVKKSLKNINKTVKKNKPMFPFD
jgi:hypothetical protein